jgi:shikimate kinase
LREVAKRRKTVVATGGGAPCRDENIEAMLAAGRVLWLDVSAEEAVARAGKASGRPLLDDETDPVAAARKLLDARRLFYKRAHAGVATMGYTPAQIVSDLLLMSMVVGEIAETSRS